MKAHRIDRWHSFPIIAGFLREPLTTGRELHRRYGPFVRLDYLYSSEKRPKAVRVIADPELYRVLLTDTTSFRNIKITPRGRRNSSTDRLNLGMTRLRGPQHEHYRKMIAPPLKRAAISAMAPQMAEIAERQVAAWPRGEAFDLSIGCRDLARHLAIGLLFGDDMKRALPIAEMITRQIDASWIFPDLDYWRWVRQADEQENAILAWAAEKRGNPNAQDLLSLLANNPDFDGSEPSAAIIGGLTSFIFGAAYDTCQNGLAWTLLLLTQHPEIMRDLTDEIIGATGGGPAGMDRIGNLPLLDSVVKEGMRLLPPVPMQMRKAQIDTVLGDEPIERHSRVAVSGFTMNRMPDIYPDPEKFRPQRWIGLKTSPYQYTVFGAGAYMCPGSTFGIQLMKIGLATALSRHAVELAPGSNIGYRTRVTLTPRGRMEIVLRERGDKTTLRRVEGPVRRLLDWPQAA